MTETSNPVERLDMLVRHWSFHKEQDIVVRIEYSRELDHGCRIYRIESVQELAN